METGEQVLTREAMATLADRARIELDEKRLEEARLDMEAALKRLRPLTQAEGTGEKSVTHLHTGGRI